MLRFRHADTRLLLVFVLAYAAVVAGVGAWWPAAVAPAAVGAALLLVAGLQLHLHRTRQSDDVAQLEHLQAIVWLTEHLQPRCALPPLTRWAATPQLAAELVARVEAVRPAVVLEAGSGASTLVVAYALERLGAGRVVSLEAEADYAEATRALLARHGLAHRARVLHAPLRDVTLDGTTWRWYDPAVLADALADVDAVDLLVVDGPPRETQRLARWPALPLLADCLAPHAVVVLDDADRPDERAVVERWRAAWPAFAVRHVASAKGVAVLEREG